jgi:hypothetical protein
VGQAEVTRNVVTGNDGGIYLAAGKLGTLNGSVENNLVTGNNFGVSIALIGTAVNDGGTGTFMIRGNTITNNSIEGLRVSAVYGSLGTFDVISNAIFGNGYGFLAFANLDGTANVTVSGNSIGYSDLSQIFLQEEVGGSLNFLNNHTLNNTVIEAPGDPDLLLEAAPGAAGLIFINGVFHPANINLP